MINNKFKLISASAITLIALTGTAYGTGINEDAKVNETEEVQELDETKQEEKTLKESEEQESDEKESGKQESDEKDESNAEDKESDEQESKPQDSSKPAEDKDEDSDKGESDKEETDKEETVDETKVVPLDDLPIHSDTGLLDFAKYHEIAKGRALPRELTKEEEEYFEEYVHVGHYEEERVGVTDTTYHLVRIYPDSYYREKDTIDMKWHKYTEIYSELLTLDNQQVFLAEREQEYQDSIEAGFIYNEELGDFELPLSDDDDVLHGVEDPKDEEGILGDQDPVENDDVVQHIHFEEQPLREDLGEYNAMTPAEFVKEYGASFLYRGIVPKNDFVQQEYKLEGGLTLAIEVEHYTEEGRDDIFLSWGVVKEPIRYDGNKGGLNLEGRYNFTTNEQHEDFIEGNILGHGEVQLRDDKTYTPQKVYVEYNTGKNEPHLYLLIADAVLDGEVQPTFSGLVGYIEYGWEVNIDEEGASGGGSDKDDNDNNKDDKDKDDDKDDDNKDDTSGSGSDSGSGSGSGEQGSGGSSDGSGSTDGGSTDGTSDSGKQDSDEPSSSERFQQTGTIILWGMLATGLGLGTVGAYLRKKSKNEEDTKDKKEE